MYAFSALPAIDRPYEFLAAAKDALLSHQSIKGRAMSSPNINSVQSRSTRLLLRGGLLTERSHAMRLNWNAKSRSCRIYEIFLVNVKRPIVSYSSISRRLILLAGTWKVFPLRRTVHPRFQGVLELAGTARETQAPSIRARVPRRRFDATRPFPLDLIA